MYPDSHGGVKNTVLGPPIPSLTLRQRWGFIKTLVSVEIKRGIPRLIIHEKFERAVKWVLRVLAAVGIAVSAVSFRAWYYSVGVAIVILVVQQFLERTVFEYTAIHVRPMPSRIEADQWTGVGFGFSPDGSRPDFVGPIFRDRRYAEEIMAVIQAWNYHEREDKNGHIHLSFIIEPTGDYSIYFYPASHRPSEDKYFDDYERETQKDKPGKRLQRIVMGVVFCKSFALNSDSLLPQFHARNLGSRPFLFTTLFETGSSYEPLLGSAIMKFTYKFAKREELTSADYEHGHGKRVMKP